MSYLIFITSLILYLLYYSKYSYDSNVSYLFISNSVIFHFIIIIIVFMYIGATLFYLNTISFFFGHLLITNFSFMIIFFVFFLFTLVMWVLSSVSFSTNQDNIDFIIILANSIVWFSLLFSFNNIFSLVFLIEIISSISFFILILSSSSNFFNKKDLPSSFYFLNLIPYLTIFSIIIIF